MAIQLSKGALFGRKQAGRQDSLRPCRPMARPDGVVVIRDAQGGEERVLPTRREFS